MFQGTKRQCGNFPNSYLILSCILMLDLPREEEETSHRRQIYASYMSGSSHNFGGKQQKNGNSLKYSSLGNFMDKGDWQTIVQGVTVVRYDRALDLTEHRPTHKHTHTIN